MCLRLENCHRIPTVSKWTIHHLFCHLLCIFLYTSLLGIIKILVSHLIRNNYKPLWITVLVEWLDVLVSNLCGALPFLDNRVASEYFTGNLCSLLRKSCYSSVWTNKQIVKSCGMQISCNISYWMLKVAAGFNVSFNSKEQSSQANSRIECAVILGEYKFFFPFKCCKTEARRLPSVYTLLRQTFPANVVETANYSRPAETTWTLISETWLTIFCFDSLNVNEAILRRRTMTLTDWCMERSHMHR